MFLVCGLLEGVFNNVYILRYTIYVSRCRKMKEEIHEVLTSNFPVHCCNLDNRKIFLKGFSDLDKVVMEKCPKQFFASLVRSLNHEEFHLILMDVGEVEAADCLNNVDCNHPNPLHSSMAFCFRCGREISGAYTIKSGENICKTCEGLA